ncbi:MULTISPECIES: hypothetical protein [unclassified Rhodococcus (in: high G+C Gram-positive bacteria)]|jgi:hypothetical protein|uniref:hypothetical protein n=1 Tax=unclassified Rhodococcus (in: high G+C Gram-positive bacteria) TaxID=192944 RepID=UPI001F0F055F|nr:MULTISPECIES: hypothetical protein [unclassified Rhodococcus (in: high G+C Gram-positive bacteria)]
MYSARFDGRFEVSPPLNAGEIEFLRAFAGPASGPHNAGRDGLPTRGRPMSWCQWTPTDDGSALVWDGDEHFFRHAEWLAYLIDSFLSPRARMRRVLRGRRDRFPEVLSHFTFDHVVDGVVSVQSSSGEEEWITVRDNVVQSVAQVGGRFRSEATRPVQGLCLSALHRSERATVPEATAVL